jgi:NTE family protein
MRIVRSFAITLLVSVALAQSQPQEPHPRPRIGLVLEGGGALGFAHIGVIEYLEEHHIPIDFVAGTSMGGLIGGFYATGKSPAQIRNIISHIDWNQVLSGQTPYPDLSYRRKQDRVAYPNRLEFGLRHGLALPPGLNSGHQVGLILDRVVLPNYSLKSFDDLPIPFRCVATNMTTRGRKVFDSGSLSQALRATMSIPGVFAPVEINGEIFTDGGAIDNLPVDVAKQAGADIVIAVDLDTGPSTLSPSSSWISAAGQTISIMIDANMLQSIRQADVLITADLRGFTSSSFTRSEEIIPKGYEAATRKQAILDRFALDDADWYQYVAQRSSRIRTEVPIPQFVTVTGTEKPTEQAIQRSLASAVNQPVNPSQLDLALTRAVGEGSLNSAGYTIIEQDGRHGLLINAYPKTYAPPFLNLGITIDGSDTQDVLFGMGARVTFVNVGGYRSEWRTDAFFGADYGVQSEYYHPLTQTSPFFVAPRAYATSTRFNDYENQNRLDEYIIGNNGFGIDLGITSPRGFEIRASEDILWFSTKARIQTDPIPNESQRQNVTSLRATFLGTDNTQLPRSGININFLADWHHNITYTSAENTGSQNLAAFTKAELQIQSFIRLSKNGSLFLAGSGGSAFGTPSGTIYLQGFSLGGPFRLSSYGINELLGNQYFLIQGGYLYKIVPLPPLFGEGVYGMAFVEGAKMYDNLTTVDAGQTPFDGTIVLIARTALGPLYVGGSFGSDNHRKWWFGLKRIF